ncbi:MAG: GH3 auxin-responsive promoter family protein [Deltaproteobacteria bacterium]
MNIARPLLRASTLLPHRAFVRDCQNPERAQARVWAETWRVLRRSPFWRGGAASLSDFALTTYDDYRDALTRSFAKERSELSAEPILYWSESTGTTGPRKLFPITPTYRRQFQTTTPAFLRGLTSRFPKLLSRPVLYFAATKPVEFSPSGVEVGLISHFNYRTIPAFLRRLYGFPIEVLASEESFSRWGPLYAVATDLSAMVGITPAAISRFFENLGANRALYEPILAGRAQPPAPLPPARLDDARRDLIRSVLDGGDDLGALWPTLQAVICWKSSTCGLQLPALRRVVGGVPFVDATYSATEGWMNVPRADGAPGGPLHPGAHVFELLPLGMEPHARNLVPMWALEPGQSYELVLTTAMGLVRYRLQDVVTCTGYFHRSPIVHFSHKSANQISLGPASVSEAELVEVLKQLTRDRSCLVAPAASGRGLELCVDEPIAPGEVSAVELALAELNPIYRRYVANGTLDPLTARRVAPDHPSFAFKRGHAQTKPRLLVQEPLS